MTELLNSAEIELLDKLVSEADNIVVCCHENPDGDALGSSLGWRQVLQKHYGKECELIVPSAFPDFLSWLPNTQIIKRYDKHKDECDEVIKKADIIFCLDFNNTSRVSAMQESLDAATAHKVLFDHHLDPDINADILVSHPERSSTSEIVFMITKQIGAFEKMDKLFSVPIYCGMMTDTGGFTYNSTDPETFHIIGDLLTTGIDKDKIYRNVYNNYSSWAIRLRGFIMSQKLNVFDELHASYFTITRRDMLDFHFIKGDAEGLVNEPLKIKGTKLSISLREDDRKSNMIWVSLRSVDDFPCNEMAERFFNGGGHLNASGGQLHCSIEEAERIVRKALEAYRELLAK